MERNRVFTAINSERDYQDKKWGSLDDPNYVSYEPSQFLIDIEIHLAKAKELNYKINKIGVMDEMRKMAALCVKCGELHGMYPRTTK